MDTTSSTLTVIMAIHYTALEAGRPSHLGSGTWKLSRLKDVTVLFGRNGAGKSALLKALGGSDQTKRHLTAPERAGDITYQARHAQEEATGAGRAQFRMKNSMVDFRERAITRLNAFFVSRGFHDSDKKHLIEFEELMNRLLPEFVFTLKHTPPYFALHREGGSQVGGVEQMSSGEAEIFSLGIDLLTVCAMWKTEGQTECVLLIDEPDTHLHPDLHHHLADFLIKLVDQFNVQVLVATHSTTLLSALGHHGGDRTAIIYLNRNQVEYRAITFNESMRQMATCLGGHALMGPLFASPLLLVEGDDDYVVWSQATRSHVLRLAVIPCEGSRIDEFRKSLETIFGSIMTPSTPQPASAYVLKDRDDGNPVNHDQSQKFVKVIKLNCREVENLYLTSEVLSAMGHASWDAAKVAILEKAPEYASKKDALEGVANTSDRKFYDIKPVIAELQSILDPGKELWKTRLGRVLGKARPTGDLFDYLGADVVEAFWGSALSS